MTRKVISTFKTDMATALPTNANEEISAADVRGVMEDIADSAFPLEDAPNEQTGASYTAVLADRGKIIERNNASANDFVIPLDATTDFPVGTASIMTITQTGAGASTVKIPSGGTLNGVDGGAAVISAQWDAVSIYKRSANTWRIQGAHGGVS